MAFSRPTLQQLIERSNQQVSSALGFKVLRRSLAGVFATVVAGMSHLLHGHIESAIDQLFIKTAEGEYLDRLGVRWNIIRRDPTFSELKIIATGIDLTLIPQLTSFQTSEGSLYSSIVDATISSGQAVVEIRSDDPGSLGNLSSGDALNLVNPISGVDSEVSVQAVLIEGLDLEDDITYRNRILARASNNPTGGGSTADIKNVVLGTGFGTRAWVFPNLSGEGSVGVTFVNDNNTSTIIPPLANIVSVQAALEDALPPMATVVVFAPIALTLDIEMEVTPNNSLVQANIIAEIKASIRRDAAPGASVYLSRINEAASIADGEFDHKIKKLNGGTPIDIPAPTTGLYELGVVTFV